MSKPNDVREAAHRLAEVTREEPSDAEVNTAIDELADKAKRHARANGLRSWDGEYEVDRLAGLLKSALSTTPASPAATSAGPTVRDVEEVYGVSAASRPAPTWQPIESAPKDGSVILAWSPYWTHVRADVFWWTKRKAWNTAKPPTHWMPLPAPPGPGAQEQE